MSRVATLSSILVAATLGLAVGLSASPSAIDPEPVASAPSPVPPWRTFLDEAKSSVDAQSARAAVWRTLDTANQQSAIIECLDTLGLVGTVDDLPLLESIAWSPDRDLHPAAIRAIARIGGPEARQLVLALSQDDTLERRQHALLALGRIGTAQDVPLLASALGDPATAHFAARALLKTDQPSAVAHVTAAFRTASPQAVRWHAMLLADSGHPDALDALRKAVDGPQPQRGAAVVALASQGDAALLPLLEEQLLTGPHQLRSEIAAALVHIDDPRAGQLLARAATTGPASVRHSALYSLAQRADDTSRRALARILLEGNNEVAMAAVWAITDIHDPDLQHALLRASRTRGGAVGRTAMSRLFQGPWPVEPPAELMELAVSRLEQGSFDGQELIGFLLQHGDASVQDQLAHALLEGPQSHRSAGVWALQSIPGDRADALLLALAKDNSAVVRQSALQVMISRGGLEAQAEYLLIRALDGGDRTAVSLLSQLGTPSALGALEQTLDHPNGQLRREALWALAGTGSDDAIQRLEAAWSDADDPAWQREIAIQLLETGRPPARIIREAMDSDDAQLLSSATRSIAQQGGPGAAAQLASLAHHDDPQVRMSALMSLGQVGGDAAETELLAALDDPDVSQIAVTTLNGLGTPAAYEALSRAASNTELPEATRISALSTLSTRSDAQSAQILDEALWDGSANVRRAAISNLGQLGTRRAGETLGDFFDAALDDPDLEDQASEAAYALRQLGGDAFEARREAIEALHEAPRGLGGLVEEPYEEELALIDFDFGELIID